MGLLTSDIEEKVGNLESKLDKANKSIMELVQKSKNKIEEIQYKVSSMKAEGVTILDEPTIKKLFDSVRTRFQEEQQKLNQIISEFQTACSEYEKKRQKLLEKEEEIIKQASQSDADFASKHELLLAPVHRYRDELEKKEKSLRIYP